MRVRERGQGDAPLARAGLRVTPLWPPRRASDLGDNDRSLVLRVELGALRVLAWEAVKLLLAVGMLALAPRLVQPLSWPALLVGMVVCLKVYWLALLWRGR